MTMQKNLINILTLFFLFSVADGQDVTVTSRLDTSRIYIGDQIIYTISVDQPDDIVLDFKPLRDTLIRNIEILSGPVQDTINTSEGRLIIENKYLITSFDSGYYRIPPVYAELKNENGIKRFYSEYNPLEVMRVNLTPPDTIEKIFDIVKPYKAPLSISEVFPWFLLVALVAIAIWGLIVLIRKFKKSETGPEPEIDPDPPHIIAFRELERLREEELWQKGDVKKYYSRLTEILRQYLERRYGVNSLEMTTSETLNALVESGFKKDEAYSTLKSVLNDADLVKFAKYKPEPAENDKSFSNSWQFVEVTKITTEGSISTDEKEGGGQ